MVLPFVKVCMFSRGGRVVWSKQMAEKMRGDPVNVLIQTVLLEEKGGTQCVDIERYRVEWRLVNELELVVACVYEASMEAGGAAGEALEALRREASAEASAGRRLPERSRLDARYAAIEKEIESRQRLAAKKKASEAALSQGVSEETKSAEAPTASTGPGSSVPRPEVDGKTNGTTKSKKKTRTWADSKKKVSAAEASALDYSARETTSGPDMSTYLPDEGETAAWDEADEAQFDDEAIVADDFDDAHPEKSRASSSATGGVVGRFAAWTTGSTLTAETIAPAMEALRERLVSKNVAAEIAGEITASVAQQLEGTKVERFRRASTLVKEALIGAVERVLTPRTSTDVLAAVLRRKAQAKGTTAHKPYVVVFVGINGVGKSTTLSKVAYYLKSHGASVSIAACDTFRSGAVEQLRRHADCLGVELFERGYLKDPADVAKAAIDHATKSKHDVVLVDTAGRMQNNDKLMRQLAKLIAVNAPDLVLFVGEALVGNDGIDQLNMFHSSLQKFGAAEKPVHGGAARPVGIDGLVLTKFDCIDDKVGAVLSMTYKTGQPVLFVGVGQKYTHLKKLSVNAVLNSLFRR